MNCNRALLCSRETLGTPRHLHCAHLKKMLVPRHLIRTDCRLREHTDITECSALWGWKAVGITNAATTGLHAADARTHTPCRRVPLGRWTITCERYVTPASLAFGFWVRTLVFDTFVVCPGCLASLFSISGVPNTRSSGLIENAYRPATRRQMKANKTGSLSSVSKRLYHTLFVAITQKRCNGTETPQCASCLAKPLTGASQEGVPITTGYGGTPKKKKLAKWLSLRIQIR